MTWRMAALAAWAAAALLALSAAAARAPVSYYVSSARGADGNAGTSPDAPWASLSRAAAVAAGLRSGDSILLRRGDVWTGPAWFLGGMRGSAAVPVTLGSYADAGAGPDRPLIARAAGAAAGPTVTVDNSSGVVLSGLEIAGGENGVAFTFDVVGGAATSYDRCCAARCGGARGLSPPPPRAASS